MTSEYSERIFLRNSETGEFFKSPDAWVSNPDEATTFQTREQALRQRETVSEPKIDMLTLDDRGRPLFGLRLWAGGS